jgi:hypothetical protein
MSEQKAPGTLRANWDDLDLNGAVGDWAFMRDVLGASYIAIRLPDGSARGCVVNFDLRSQDWTWDGNETAPTITQEIARVVGYNKFSWRGYMRAGVLEVSA